MGRVADPELALLWRDRVERQGRSGLSILEYCRREEISAGSFHAWKRRLRTSRSRVDRKAKPRGGQREAPRGGTSAGGFVQFPLTVKSTIDVCFADGTVLSMPPENLAALALTLKTLHAAQCEGAAR